MRDDEKQVLDEKLGRKAGTGLKAMSLTLGNCTKNDEPKNIKECRGQLCAVLVKHSE